MMIAALAFVAYLIGAIPASYIAGRVRGVDLRAVGSGNLGATNTVRSLGWGPGIAVLLFDILKGWFPTAYFPAWTGVDSKWAVLFGVGAILGHTLSPYVGFKGGKGVATTLGVFFAVAPVPTLASVLAFGVVFAATRMVSAGSIALALTLAIGALMSTSLPLLARISAVIVALFVIWKHRSNIGRIANGTEARFGRSAENREKGK